MQSKSLKEILWDIRPDENWVDAVPRPGSQEGDETHQPHSFVAKHLDLILKAIHDQFPIVESGYAVISGVQPGVYVPVASLGRDLEGIPNCDQDKSTSLLADFLNSTHQSVFEFRDPKNNTRYVGNPSTTAKLLIKLIAGNELFGAISLDTSSADYFTQNLKEQIEELQPYISRLVAETVFSSRLWQLAKPLQRHNESEFGELCEEIVSRALLSFGASGCILRLYSEKKGRLDGEYVQYADDASESVVEELLSENSTGVKICNAVLNDPEYDWTVGQIGGNHSAEDIHGVRIPPGLERELESLKVGAYSVFRLATNDPLTARSVKVGTLSVFHMHNQGYSWRDVALAKQLVDRAADVIVLHRQKEELVRTQEDLMEANELLEIEGEMSTRAEVVTLLSHDLGHKALAVDGWFQDYQTKVKKAIRDRRSYSSLEKVTEDGETAIQSLIAGMNTVNKLFSSRADSSDAYEEFSVEEAALSVESTLKAAMNRNNCTFRADPGQHNIRGNRNIFLLVLFNLIINSIDAQKSRTRKRPMELRLSCVEEGGKLYINYWDNGPGINRTLFPVPDDIFLLGKTSKEKGTGRGLTISRNLLGQFFGGDLYLNDPATAHFRIVIPRKGTT